jgi:succinate-semialdehyde dehydrogenase / glutarate-semialdehyde dehydrogenase
MSPTESKTLGSDLFINGQWRPGAGGSISNIDPGSGDVIGAVTLATPADTKAALDAAAAAFPAWSALVPAQRGALLKRAAAILQRRFDEASTALLCETGKTTADARGEMQRAIDTLAWNGEQAGRIEGRIHQGMAAGSERFSMPVPLGVVVIVTAWNFPAVLAARKLGAVLAAGCTAVFKASEFCPATARLFVECLVEAGLPQGVVNLVFGNPAAISAQLLASPVVKALTFTGSTAVGKQLAALAAPNLIRPVLELGGHAPVIVWEDANIDHVIATTSPAKFGSAGQSCVAPSRYLVHASLHERFARALADKAKSYKVGHGLEAGVTLGAVAHQGRVDALARLTKDAVSKGASLLAGGQQVQRSGFYFAPTVLADVPVDADIMREEPFGPIAALLPVVDIDQAIGIANAAPYSFAAYLFTDSLAVRNRVLRGLHASNIGINQMAPSLPDAPLGGLGNSGYGYEGGNEGVLSFTQFRLVSQSAPA